MVEVCIYNSLAKTTECHTFYDLKQPFSRRMADYRGKYIIIIFAGLASVIIIIMLYSFKIWPIFVRFGRSVDLYIAATYQFPWYPYNIISSYIIHTSNLYPYGSLYSEIVTESPEAPVFIHVYHESEGKQYQILIMQSMHNMNNHYNIRERRIWW